MTPAAITDLFTRDDRFHLARWNRPIAPVIFGLADDSLAVFRTALTAALRGAGAAMAETDPETGANLIALFAADWAELAGVPDLDRLTGQPDLPARLAASEARRYRLFRYDPDGGIRAAIALTRVQPDDHPAQLAEHLGVNTALTFARETAPSAQIAALIRAAYDPRLPVASTDPATALRLAARL